MTGNGKTITYKYNDSGIRTQKTVNGVTTTYHLVGDKVTFETNGTDNIYYTYDASDSLVSMNLNGVEYYYIRNNQRDIIGLHDSTGVEVVSYSYDSWGKLISTTGTLASSVGVKNPYRYRGYRYDTETSLYYLQSRYYYGDWGRFVNGDDSNVLQITQGELLSDNLFAYCKNNAVNNYDPDGHIVAQVIGALIGAGFGGLLGKKIADYYGYTGLKRYAVITGFAVGGAIVGTFAGWLVSKLATSVLMSITGVGTTWNVDLGSKLQYIFGKATGTLHNIERSVEMLRQLNRIGIFDNPNGRSIVANALRSTFQNVNNIVKIQENGRVLMESLLLGPNGVLKMQTVWDGTRLITIQLFGGK